LGALAAWTGTDVGETHQLLRGVVESMTSAPSGTTVVVGVDDAHMLDDLSTVVLHQIVNRGTAKIVLTVRDGEPVPAATRELWSGDTFNRLDVQALSHDETATLLCATLGGRLDPDAATKLWKLTRGNVLYLHNIVEREVAEGRLVRQREIWRWVGEPVMPPGLIELIEARMGALPASVTDVVDTLAVSEPIEIKSLARITDLAAIEEAEVRGLISLDPAGGSVEVRVAHPLYGEVRRKRAATTRLRRLRGVVATELARSEERDDIRTLVRRAALSLDSDLEPDPDLLGRAAHGAAWLADLRLVDRLAAKAIHAGAGPEVHIMRSRALTWLGRGIEADAVLAAIDTTQFTDVERARLTALRAANVLWALVDPGGAKAIIDDASRTTSPGSRGFLDAFLALYWAVMGKPDAAGKALADLDLDKLPGSIGVEAAWAMVKASGDAGRITEAEAGAELAYRVSSRNFDVAQMRLTISDTYVSALLLAGKVRAALDTAQRLFEQAADLPGGAQLLSRGVVGRAELGAGRLDAVCSLLEPVVEVFSTADASSGLYAFAYRFQFPRTVALAIRGSTDQAVAALDALHEERFLSWQFLDYERVLARAWVAAAQGAVSAAISTLLMAAESARTDGRFAAEVLFLQTATQLGDRSTAQRLRDLESIVEGPRVGIAARFATAMYTGDGTELASVSEEFENMGDLIAALDAASHAAMAFRRDGLRGSALKCSTRAEALADQCGGASTPAQRQASDPLTFSSREREIVALIGQGLSNKAIAQRLTLSTRTVEGHIYRAMTKTGTANREDLAALLPPPRPPGTNT
jgi:DNA-binding CsgD family transcriptional regulator